MDSHLDVELDALKARLLVMANHAAMAVSRALEALLRRDEILASQVKEGDWIIDRFEIEIDYMGLRQLTKAPLGADLRLVTVATKIARNLERIGDEAAKIARRAADLCREAPVEVELDIKSMAGLVLDMLRSSRDSFRHGDSGAARAILPRDKEVDLFNMQIHNILSQYMLEHPKTIKRCLHWMVVSKSLERIADHATNIAEDVVYLYSAQDIRYTGARFGKMPLLAG
jgi:phosphate transport system protein